MTTDLENEKIINYLVLMNKAGRQLSLLEDSRWGGLIRPDPGENPDKTEDGLKVVIFASWKFGYLLLETLKQFETRFPGKLSLVGLVTDNPLNPDAKISKNRRVWKFLDVPYQVINEAWILESALTYGIPVYTGEVKVASFQVLLQLWNPDAIIVCVFGQILNASIFDYPAYGAYNFHPSDLSRNEGAGPAPYDNLIERNASTTVWSVHKVIADADQGPVIGLSPPVNVRNTRDMIPDDPLLVYDKIAEMLGPMGTCLMEELCGNYERNQAKPIEKLDFCSRISEEIKRRNMRPIDRDHPEKLPQEPGDISG